MNKLFLAIYFIFGALLPLTLQARTIELNDAAQTAKAPKPFILPTPEGLPDPNNTQEVINFFRERFKNSSVSRAEELGDLNKSNAMDIQHGAEYIKQMQEQKKSTFEKIYDQAMGRISNSPSQDTATPDTTFYEQVSAVQQSATNKTQPLPNIPVVNVLLPTGTKVVAPAREHIPYLLVSYNILPTGLIQVQEDITVIANGQKLKHGLTKMLPKYTTSRANVRKKLDIQLLSVTVNGKEIPYVLEEIGDNIYFKPKEEYLLQPGVYTYSFKYMLDRKLWYYDDFAEFYSDVAGSYLNLVITSANAIVSIPDGKNFLTQNVITGASGHLSHKRAMIAALDHNALGFASTTPLLPGEGMHILVSLDKNTFIEPGYGRQFTWFITDYGDVLFALCGLLFILFSYMLSWSYIKKNKSRLRVAFKRTAPAIRYLLTGSFDKTSFIAGLLEFYRKNIIDIQKQDGTILFIKKTDNLTGLTRSEKKTINQLFPGKEAVISVKPQNTLKFTRAQTTMEKGTRSLLQFLSFRLNIGYLVFSVGMLVLTITAIAFNGINSLQTLLVLLSSTALIAFYIWIMKRPMRNKLSAYGVKIFAILFIAFAILFMSVYIRLISAIILAVMLYVIFEYSELFSKRSGLLKSKIKEAEELRKYLMVNAPQIGRSKEFSFQQPNIFALNVEYAYPENDYNKAFYRLNLANELLNLI